MLHRPMLAFIDETGDHNLVKVAPEYPVFGLGALVITEENYELLNETVESLKAKYFEDPQTFILHSSELKRPIHRTSDVRNQVMLDATTRASFYSDFDNLILRAIPFSLVICLLEKERLVRRYADPADPYHFSFENLLNRIIRIDLREHHHLIAECRGPELDSALMSEYQMLCRDGIRFYGADSVREKTSLSLARKEENNNGLQVIDLLLACFTRRHLGKSQLVGNDLTPALVYAKLACPPTIFPT